MQVKSIIKQVCVHFTSYWFRFKCKCRSSTSSSCLIVAVYGYRKYITNSLASLNKYVVWFELTALPRDTICFWIFYKQNLEYFSNFDISFWE